MRKILTLLALASTLAGCASTLAGCASTVPTCDGKDRRPINVPVRAEIHYPSCGVAA